MVLFGRYSLESLNYLVIEPFDLAVGLWMSRRGVVVSNMVPFDESFEFTASKLFSIVCQDLRGLPTLINDVFDQCCCCCAGLFGIRSRICLGCCQINHREDILVAVRRFDQRTYPVYLPEVECALLAVRMNRHVVLRRGHRRRLVELTRDAGI